MDVDVFHGFLVGGVVRGGCSDVAFPEVEDFELVGKKDPDSNIELSTVEKEGFF